MGLAVKMAAVASAGVLVAGGVLYGSAQASNPATLGYDVNTTSDSISFPSSPGVLSSESVECDAAADTVVGGGVILDNAAEGSPIRAFSWHVVSSGPQVGGAGFKDSWHASMVGTNSSYDYDYTVYVICKKS